MKILFRQGIVSRQSGQFLQVVGDNVDLLAVNRSATVTIAIRDTDYIHSEDNTVASAWVGPFPVDANPADANAYLYWDFDPLTFERTFGWTTLAPAAQSVEPGSGNTPIIGVVPTTASPPVIQGSFEVSGQYVLTTNKSIAVINSTGNDGNYTVQSATYNASPGTTTIIVKEEIPSAIIDGDINLDFDIYGLPLKQVGRTWYDTANHIHYELNISNQWVEVVRVFAARLNNANSFFSMSINSDFTGSQIGDVSSVFAGRVLFAESNKPITRDDGTFFTTEDQFFTNQSRVDALRLESNVSRAKSVSGGTLAAFGIVQWVGDGEITTAQYNDTGDTVVGVLTEDTIAGEVGAVIVQGTVTNPDWSWDSALVGKALWIKNGELVSIDPHLDDPINHLTPQVPVARVLSGDTVIFEQGLGGTGPQGPIGTITNLPLANNELVQGVVSLSHAPVNDLFPIAAGENHPVLTSGPYSVDGHGHTAAQVSFETIPGSIDSTDVQSAIGELNDKKLSLTGGTLSNFLTLHSAPSNDLHAATKAYVDALAQGIDAKEAVVVATTANFGGTYSPTGGTGGTGDITTALISSLDGTYGTDYFLVVGSRILVKDQTDDFENGLYVVTVLGAGSPPTTLDVERSPDFDEDEEVLAGSYVLVRAGLELAGTGWALTDIHPDDDIIINEHPIVWTLVSSATGGNNWVYANTGDNFNIPPVAAGFNAISIGNSASAGYTDSISIGTGSEVTGTLAIAIGLDAYAAIAATSVGRGSSATGNSSCAFGGDADALADSAIAIGRGTYARSARDICIGEYATTETGGGYSIVVGVLSSTLSNVNNATVLGKDSIAAQDFQVLIGNSVTSAAVTSDVPYSVKLGYAPDAADKNMLHLFSKGKLELYGDEAQYVIPNYVITGSPFEVPANAEEGGLIYDSIAKGLQLYDGTSWSVIGGGAGGGATVLDDLTDVILGSPPGLQLLSGQVLEYNGSDWVNALNTNPLGDLTVVSIPASDTIISTKDTFALEINGVSGAAVTYQAPQGYDTATLTYLTKSLATVSSTQAAPFISPDGVYLFTIKRSGGIFVYRYTLSTPWDISTSGAPDIQQVDDFFATVAGLWISSDGLTLWLFSLASVYQWTFGTAWDVSTLPATEAATNLNIWNDGAGDNVFVTRDGVNAYRLKESNNTVEWAVIGVPGDITSISFASLQSLTAYNPTNVTVNNDGSKMFVLSETDVHEFNLAVAYDPTSLTFVNTIDLSGTLTSTDSAVWDLNGTNYYVFSRGDLAIYQFSSDASGGGTNFVGYFDDVAKIKTTVNGVKTIGVAELSTYSTAGLPTGVDGGLVYDSTTEEVKVYNGSNFVAIGAAVPPSYKKFVLGGSPVSQVLDTTPLPVSVTAGSPIQTANIQVFRNGILQNEDTTTGGGIDGDFEVTGPNELTFSDDSLQPGGIVIIYVFS